MKFTILGHAGMLVEAAGARIAIDPWILGSCYWRSWWNYPPAPAWLTRIEELDYVYLTHLHWDHFHGPSLRKLPRSATLLVPESHFPRMRDDARSFRFAGVVEMPHAKPLRLPGGLELTSYQYGLMMDSALVISDGRTTLVDMNDCKLSGRPLRQVIARHPRVDFVFRSHSSASAYPWCVETDDPSVLAYRSNEDYLRDFTDTARLLHARYAVPFASAHCFLHRDTFRFNDTVVSPADVKAWFDAHRPEGSECVAMVAGDAWSDASGFEIASQDWFSNRHARLAAYAAQQRPQLEAQYALEAETEMPFRAFERYFRAQLGALPRLSRLVFRPVVVFELKDRPHVHWVVDYGRRTVEERDQRPEHYDLLLEIPALVLKDCVYKKLFSTFSASRRVRIEVRGSSLRNFLIFFTLLDMVEYEYFPLRNLLRPRFVRVWLRRWREIGVHVSLIASLAFRRRGEDPLARFMPRTTPGSHGGSGA
jgi:UDP-MurNAc hydroxylase